MKNSAETNRFGSVLALAALIILCTGASAGTGDAVSGQAVVSPPQGERIAAMKIEGLDASLTILAIRLAGQPLDRLTEVIGLLLEQKGVKNIELGKSAFTSSLSSPQQGQVQAVLCRRWF